MRVYVELARESAFDAEETMLTLSGSEGISTQPADKIGVGENWFESAIMGAWDEDANLRPCPLSEAVVS